MGDPIRTNAKQTVTLASVYSTKRLQRRSRGKLGTLPNMPLDILYEIFGYLHPRDLLKLSRLTKSLRATLLRRSARTVWMDALESVPNALACPSDMQEPQWAQLLFDLRCSFCETPNTRVIIWQFRVRTCKTCFTNDEIDGRPGPFTDSMPKHSELSECVSSIHGVFSGVKPRCFRKEVDEVLDKYGSLKTDQAKTTFLAERREFVICRDKDLKVSQCDAWLEECRSERSEELYELRNEREKAIKEKLCEIGYADELKWMKAHYRDYEFRHSKFVRDSKALTPRIWGRIRPALVELMENFRKERLAELRSKRLYQRGKIISKRLQEFYSQNYHQVKISFTDLCQIKEVKAILEWSLEDSGDDAVTVESFDAIFSQFELLLNRWRHRQSEKLLLLLRPILEKDHGGLSTYALNGENFDFDLAVAVFQCERCNTGPLPALDIVQHNCPFDRLDYTVRNELPEIIRKIVEEDRLPLPWNFRQCIHVHEGAYRCVKAILDCCNMDPVTMTRCSLDIHKQLFVCRHCPRLGDSDHSFYWRGMFDHIFVNHDAEEASDLVGLLETNTNDDLDFSQDPLAIANDMTLWCPLCCNEAGALSNYNNHLQEFHGSIDITTPSERSDAQEENHEY